ncbi:MAG: phage virion morphogenesis protein [Candidatus Paceibacterota bacterium]|jgi:phage gpG-like protein
MITARFNDDRIDAALKKIADRGVNLSTPLSACGEILLTSIDKNFESQGRYRSVGDVRGGSTRWQPLAAATVLSRLGGSRAFSKAGTLRKPAQRKLEGLKILQVRGALAASFSKKVSGNSLTVGSNRIYTALQHYGGKAGRGRKVTVPGRPILVVQDEDVERMVGILVRYVFD